MTPWHQEWRVRHPVRGELWVEAFSTPVQDGDGAVTWHGIIIEVSDRKRIAQELRSSEARFREVISLVPQLVWSCDSSGGCTWMNPQWSEYTGVPAAQEPGDGWRAQVHPDDQGGLEASWQQAVESGQDCRCDFRIRRYDGAYRWFDTRAVALREPSGQIIQWFGTNTDVHEEPELREAPRREAELVRRWGDAFQHCSHGIAMGRPGEERPLVCNPPTPGCSATRWRTSPIDRSSRSTSPRIRGESPDTSGSPMTWGPSASRRGSDMPMAAGSRCRWNW